MFSFLADVHVVLHKFQTLFIFFILIVSKTSTISCLQRVDVTVWRNGHEYKQSFEFGKSITPLSGTQLPSDQKGRTGTRVKFLPDKQGM